MPTSCGWWPASTCWSTESVGDCTGHSSTTIPRARCGGCTPNAKGSTRRSPTASCRSTTVPSARSPRRCCDAARDRHTPGRADRSLVGREAIGDLRRCLPEGVRRVAVVSQHGLVGPDGALDWDLAGLLGDLDVVTHEIGVGEEAKSLTTIERLARGFAEQGLTRRDVVVGVGGGMVTDVAGFAAATWHRGVPVVHVSTTLLGMVDAAIGGKTGVNLPEGKNLVGAFWQPSAVVCDLDALDTLPPREMRCGLGEMAKYHFLTGDDLLAMELPERIARCVQIKAEVVASDEREGGRRALLNYGHTLAHAVEIATDHRVAHGEAVAIGLVFAAELACDLGRIDDDRVADHRRIVAGGYDLAVRPPPGVDPDELLTLMARDKKALDGLTFVLDGHDGPEVVAGVEGSTVRHTLERFVS